MKEPVPVSQDRAGLVKQYVSLTPSPQKRKNTHSLSKPQMETQLSMPHALFPEVGRGDGQTFLRSIGDFQSVAPTFT